MILVLKLLTSYSDASIWNKILDEVQEPDCFVLEDSTAPSNDIVY